MVLLLSPPLPQLLLLLFGQVQPAQHQLQHRLAQP
jgi:hypothetical protein